MKGRGGGGGGGGGGVAFKFQHNFHCSQSSPTVLDYQPSTLS